MLKTLYAVINLYLNSPDLKALAGYINFAVMKKKNDFTYILLDLHQNYVNCLEPFCEMLVEIKS